MCAVRVTQVSCCIDLMRLQLLKQASDDVYICIAQVFLCYCTYRHLQTY